MHCTICQSDNIKPLFVAENIHGRTRLSDDTFTIAECQNCNITFTDIAIDEKFYDTYYNCDYYESRPLPFLLHCIVRILSRISFAQKLRLIGRFKSRGSSLLEIGSGKGGFLSRLPSYFKKSAVEINEKGYRYLQNRYPDIIVYTSKIEKEQTAIPASSFDCIVMWHAFEHIDNPGLFLQRIYELLKPDGAFIIEIPNRNSFGFRFTKKRWFHLDAPRHLFHYSYRSLFALLQKHKLRIVSTHSNPFDYPQDFSASIFSQLKTSSSFRNIVIGALVIPITLLIRLVVSVIFPLKSEIITFVVKKDH